MQRGGRFLLGRREDSVAKMALHLCLVEGVGSGYSGAGNGIAVRTHGADKSRTCDEGIT